MAENNVTPAEDAEMPDCDGEKVVTMMDVLQEQQDFEDDANAVLGASDEKECTYSKGYIKRQAIYACLTCCSEAKEDESKRAGVCLACSLNCHENHELVELYTKRNFRCDCGNPKFNNHPCQFTPDKSEMNEENSYNQNFSGLYCVCHRPYPDPESNDEDEMIQCIICEDWLHAAHLEATVPNPDIYAEMICKPCMDKNEFLHDYSEFAVNSIENGDVDVVNESIVSNGLDKTNGDDSKADEQLQDKTVSDVNMSVTEEKPSDKENTENGDKIDSNSPVNTEEKESIINTESEETADKESIVTEKVADESSVSESKPADSSESVATESNENQEKQEVEEANKTVENLESETNSTDNADNKPTGTTKDSSIEPSTEENSIVTEPAEIQDREKPTDVSGEQMDTDKNESTTTTTDDNAKPIENGEDKDTAATTNGVPENNDNKRKLPDEESEEQDAPKKPKFDTCTRPKGVKRVLKGAAFWPPNFRQKLCTCSICLDMYKDLSVLFLTDPEDTVTAYETLGKEMTDGVATTQYEKGLEALSSLGRIQQINALTEYNKMRDKLLDFLKSFKDRKEVVKEEDIKAFFAGMKPKRESDGVYFCR